MLKDSQIVEGTIKEIEGNLVLLTKVIDTAGRREQPDQVINTYSAGFVKFVILEKEVSAVV